MNRLRLRGLYALLFAVVVLCARPARAAYVPPPIAGHVTDAAGKLSTREVSALNEKLARYLECSGNHVAVFLPRSLEGSSIEDVAYVTFNTWKIGAAKKDNGALLVLAPEERRVRIETGKGIEGDLTDIESSHILRDVVIQNMKTLHFFAAADQATTRIANALGGCAVTDIAASGWMTTDPATTGRTTSDPLAAPSASPHLPTTLTSAPSEHMRERIAMAGALAVLALLIGIALRAYFFAAGASFIVGELGFLVMTDVGRPRYGSSQFDLDAASAVFFFGALLLVCVNIAVWVHRWRNRNAPIYVGTPGGAGASSADASSLGTSNNVGWTGSSASSSSSVGWTGSSGPAASGTDSIAGASTTGAYSGGGGTSGGGGASDSY